MLNLKPGDPVTLLSATGIIWAVKRVLAVEKQYFVVEGDSKMYLLRDGGIVGKRGLGDDHCYREFRVGDLESIARRKQIGKIENALKDLWESFTNEQIAQIEKIIAGARSHTPQTQENQ